MKLLGFCLLGFALTPNLLGSEGVKKRWIKMG